MQVGLVGYPNVGKSSTINALIGSKKVSVSSTPGKTKHFQTIHLSNHIILCDCPGLVFPNFATTKAELVCNGILPIDQMREYNGPVGLVAQRIPRAFLEAIYGIRIAMRPLEEGGTGIPTARELLFAYAKARGFTTQGKGEPDASRAEVRARRPRPPRGVQLHRLPGCDRFLGGQVFRSIISPGVRVNSYALIEDSILFDGVDVGRRAILAVPSSTRT